MGNRQIKILLIVLATALYFLLCLLDNSPLPGAATSLAIIPIVMTAAWFGMNAGMVFGLLVVLGHLFLFSNRLPDVFPQLLTTASFWAGQVLLIATGAFIGMLFERFKRNQTDLKDQLKSRAALEDQEIFYRHITENLTDLIIIIDENLHATYTSPSILKVTGYTAEEVHGQLRKLLLDPDEVPFIQEKVKALIEKPGSTIKISPIRIMHKDGSRKFFEGYLTNLLDDPHVRGIVTSGYDISEHILATRELRHRENLYNRLIHLSPTAIAIHRDGVFVFANPAAMALMRASQEEEIVGRDVLDFVHPDDRQTVAQRIQRMSHEGAGVDLLEERLIRLDGAVFPAELFAIPIIFEGEFSFLVMVRDISIQKEAERALLESENKYRALFEQNNDGVILMDLEGEILDVNPTIIDWTGVKKSNWVGRKFHSLIPAAQANIAEALIETLIENGTSPSFEFEFPNASGEIHPVEMTLSVARDETGYPLFIQCFTRDIQKRKESEALLKEREIRYRSLFEQSNDAIFLFRDRKVVETNQKAAEMLQYPSPNEMVGLEIDQLVAREELSEANQFYETLANGDAPSVYERLGMRVNNNITPMEVKAAPIFDEEGKLLYIQSIARDISHRREMEKRLKEFENRYRALFQQTSDAIILFQLNGEVVEANRGAAVFYGYSTTEDMVGIQIMKHILPDEIEDEQKKLAQLVAGVDHSYYERTTIRKDGKIRIGEVNLTLVRDSRGLPSLIQSIIRDITKRKNDEKRLKDKATYDSLTNLLNRQTFIEQIAIKLLDQPIDDDHGALMFIDLDDFKPVNDRYGHSAGDFALRTIANRLMYCARESDLIARHGGDEFVIWLENIRTQESAMQVADRIVNNIAEPILYESRLIQVSCSIGIHLFPHPGSTPDELIKKADRAMYEAKQLGKNKIFVFQD